ncbi:MAG: radical SAM protein [Desulfobacteraceae bacterium]|nr:radical SAM protein [Desulfobacteraceae bacterium]
MLKNHRQKRQQWLVEEEGTIRKDWSGKLRIALAFPNRYSVGMSNLGFQSVYSLLNLPGDVVCERVFYPEPEDMAALGQSPGRLVSLESQRSLREFDLIAFSIPFENDYPHAIEMLHLAGIPPRAEARDRSHPLVAAGGVAVFLNPEPLADFLDFLFIGEGEDLVPEFLEAFRRTGEDDPPRAELLETLAREVPGIYVPSLYRVNYRSDGQVESIEPRAGARVPERVVYRRADLSRHNPCQTVILTPNTEFSNVELVEIGRGCGRGCRFCAAGFVYRPVRYHAADKLLLHAGGRLEGHSRIGLVSAAVSDHPEISALCDALVDRGASLSFSSLRADTITPGIVSTLEASRHQSVAIAPEAGSDRLRRAINKNLEVEQIYAAVERLTERGILHLKLYFMIGLPTETNEDLDAVVELAKGIKHHVLKVSRGLRRLGTITLSVNSFVPKPFTPFQWSGFAGVVELKERARRIQRALRKVPNVRVHFDLPKWAYVQALLARGDRRAGSFLEKVALGGLSWTQALKSVPFNPDFWVMRERDRDELFPWEIIECGTSRSYLWDEYMRSLEGRSSPPCRPEENCRRCGACTP